MDLNDWEVKKIRVKTTEWIFARYKQSLQKLYVGSMSNYVISILYLEITPFFIWRKKNVRGDGSFVRWVSWQHN